MTTKTKQCPYSVYTYSCEGKNCGGCVIRIEAKRKADEPRECEPAYQHLKNVLGTKGVNYEKT